MTTVDVREAKASLSQLIDRAADGEEIVITRAGRPLCRLVPLQPAAAPRRLGQFARQTFWVAEDFDRLPADLHAAFEGG